jgi:DNA repair protein RadB
MEKIRVDSRNKISAGNYELNKFLFGGYEKDIITTIYGSAGSGKSNFCLMACASVAKKNEKVIFIDTEGGFSLERLKQIANLDNSEDFKKILENILILKPTNFEEQWGAFGELLKELRGDKEKRIGLIIVDGMTMLYRLELAENTKDRSKVQEINSKLARQMRLLAEIARKENIPVLITNQVYSEFLSEEELRQGKERQVFMVGGDILRYWSKCILELKNERGRRTLVIRKHRSIGDKKLDFEIISSGIKRRGIF